MRNLAGKFHVFEDGSKLEVLQVKLREVDNETKHFLTILITQSRSLPRKTIMTYEQFERQYGHLFPIEPKPRPPPLDEFEL